MQLLVVQFLSGLASAASLFLVASGLSLIFGVTRIVNFAHGAFFMIGAYLAFTLTDEFSGPLGFWWDGSRRDPRRPFGRPVRDPATQAHLSRAGTIPASRDFRCTTGRAHVCTPV